jgi:DeoR family transcriptional regulator, fructose operon transcriptional repressor
VDQLCRELNVSPATVRRDLEALEKVGRIRRVHGGAVSAKRGLEEPSVDDRTTISVEQKRRIAEKAVTLIEPGETVYLDGGSTVLEVARLLKGRSDITVVTNSLRAAAELSGAEPRLILVGGELRRRSQTMVGTLTRFLLQQIHVDKAFMGTIGFSLQEGPTTTDPNEAFTKELVVTHADKVILLADSRKAGRVSFAQAGRLEDVDVLVVDAGLSESFAEELEGRGLEVIRV